MICAEQVEQVVGARACDRDGDQVGTGTRVYLDVHGRPNWIALDTEPFVSAEVFVPADGPFWTSRAGSCCP